RLVAPDMFSGWGIRTLSERAANYDPRSYHNGSVWPFDTALAVAGMRQYGFAAEAERVARALVEASIEFPMRRPPELFCGDERTPKEPPTEYWNTCTPQLWSAAAMFTCVASILGLEADHRRKTLRIAPIEALKGIQHPFHVVGQETGDAGFDQLRGGAVPESDHRRPADHRLDHRHAERLLPLDGKDQRPRLRQELRLFLALHVFAPDDLAV